MEWNKIGLSVFFGLDHHNAESSYYDSGFMISLDERQNNKGVSQ